MTARRRDAQIAVSQLLSEPGVILAGHALHHDLWALRLDFQPVIDTSLLFSYRHVPLAMRAAPPKCPVQAAPEALAVFRHENVLGRQPQLVYSDPAWHASPDMPEDTGC